MNALPYQQPPEPILLPLAGFLLALHFVAYPLDKLFACGLLGQLVVGIIWGPLASWLSLDIQRTVVQLGYIGIILLVYEGGLRTDLKLLLNTFGLSVAVATTGIVLPIALSFVLLVLIPGQISALTAFTAGASLCSTSLGTTYAVISAAKLHTTRVGTILVIAAMMDDLVGLVLVTVVSSLSTHVKATSIIRPIFVSIAFLVAYIIGSKLLKRVVRQVSSQKWKFWVGRYSFAVAGLVLLGTTAGAGYAGTSILFAGYLTGVSANYVFPHHAVASYFETIANWLLVPFFFASMGFAIPVQALFDRSVVWRGLVYTVLMMLGKLATGLCLYVVPLMARLSSLLNPVRLPRPLLSRSTICSVSPATDSTIENFTVPSPPLPTPNVPESQPSEPEKSHALPDKERQVDQPVGRDPSHGLNYAIILLSCAMNTRGEIGFLVAAIGQSVGILVPEEVYLVVIWAIVLCTLLGPIGTGFVVWRIRKANETSGGNVLGTWG